MPSKQTASAGDQNLSICVRIRPMSKEELKKNALKVCYRVDEKLISMIDPMDEADIMLRSKRSRNREYTFDHAFDETSSQEDVFQATTASLIEHVANGYNATVFASGATGAGKTHTMVGTEADPGIMVRAMDELLNFMVQTSDEYLYTIGMAYMELYNELIRDLLNPGSDFLELREDTKGIQVVGLREVEPTTRQEVFELLQRGNQNRTTEPTAANRTSSRSHAILQITVRQRSRVVNVTEEINVGKLFLIDLAGSERASKTLNRGKRMTEGAHINRSLLALGNCINALADTNSKRYVNFRDSKLTRLLKEALAGNCRTVMIAHISPSSWHFEESYNTLVYADRAKSIKTKVRRNVVDVNHHISQYTQLIEELRNEIAWLKSNLTETSGNKTPDELNQQLNNLKETLILAYQKQLDLRRELVSVRNRLLEVELEETRQNMVISEWECSRVTNGTVSTCGDSQNNLQYSASMDPIVAEIARKRCATFQTERVELEVVRARVEKEHQEAERDVKKLQQTLLQQTRRTEEREIITLLARLHELELERADLDARYAISDTELKKREFLLDQLRQDNRLSEAIIRYQCTLLDTNKVERPKELELLLELYEQQGNASADRRVSFTGSSMDFRMIPSALTNGLQSKVSASLSSLPTDGVLDENRYSRTAKWLEYSGSRRASDAEPLPHYNSGLGNGQPGFTNAQSRPLNGTGDRPNQRRIRMHKSISAMKSLDANQKSVSHPEIPSIRTHIGSEESRSSSSENIRPRNSDLATKTISAVARKRKDQKIREKKQKLRTTNALKISQTNTSNSSGNSANPVNNSTLSDIGESPDPNPPGRSFGPALSNETDPWPTIAGSRIIIEPQKMLGRRPNRLIRDDRPDSSSHIPSSMTDPRPALSRCSVQTDMSQTEPIDRQAHPLTKAVKVTTMEIRAQKIQTAAKSHKPTRTELRSGIPRSRSTPRPVQISSSTQATSKDHVPILQVPQLVRIGDHQADDQCDMKRTKLNIRHANVENPVHQKHINERRQLRTVNQTENT